MFQLVVVQNGQYGVVYKDNEREALGEFKTYDEAYTFMEKDFWDTVRDYEFTVVGNRIFSGDEDISDITFIIKEAGRAQIDDEGMDIDDKLTWALWEREL